MHYLMEEFKRTLISKKYNFNMRNNNGTYILDLYDLPIEIDIKLANLSINNSRLSVKKIKGRIIRELKEPEYICESITVNNKNIIRITFNKDDYGLKINKLIPILKFYDI